MFSDWDMTPWNREYCWDKMWYSPATNRLHSKPQRTSDWHGTSYDFQSAGKKRGDWARGGDKHMMGKLHNTIHQNDWKPQVRDWIPFWVVNDLRSGCVNLRGRPKEHTRSQLKPTPDLKNGGATKAARTSSRSSSLGFSNILHRIPKCMFPFMFSSHMIYSDSRFIRD